MEGFELLPIVSDRDFDLVQFSKKYRAFRVISPECRVSVWLCDELFFEIYVCMSHQDLAFMSVLMEDIFNTTFFFYITEWRRVVIILRIISPRSFYPLWPTL